MQDSMVAILGKTLSILMLMPPFGNKLVTVRVSKIKPSLFQHFYVIGSFQSITIFGIRVYILIMQLNLGSEKDRHSFYITTCSAPHRILNKIGHLKILCTQLYWAGLLKIDFYGLSFWWLQNTWKKRKASVCGQMCYVASSFTPEIRSTFLET